MSHDSSPFDDLAAARRSPATILLVDDNPANLLTVKVILDDPSLTLVTAQSGPEALAILEQRDCAAVLLDVQMSEWDGFETARRIRAHRKICHTPIIFLTAFEADQETVERAYSLGAVDFLVKPLMPTVLRAKVAGFVDLWEKTQQIQMQAEQIRQVELTITRIPGQEAPLFTAFLRDLTHNRQSEHRRAARLKIAELIASARSLSEAVAGILTAICEALEWDVGAIWTLDRRNDVLQCFDFWMAPTTASAGEFEALSRQLKFPRGLGLPGRVWSTGKPAWIADVTNDPNFPRAAAAIQNGLHGAFGFPIRAGAEFIGVIEFFSREIREPDIDLLEMMSTIGSQIGQFMQREFASEALRQSEHTFAGFMQHLPGLAWIKDADGRYVYVNEAAERAFQTPRDQLYGKTDRELFPPETAEQFVHNDLQARQSESGVQVVETLEHGDGALHHSLVSKFPIREAGLRPVLVGGMAIDITDLKRAEQALRESEERFRSIFNQAAIGVGRSDTQRVLIDVNPGLCRMLGYEREELVGRSIKDISHPDEWEASGEALQPLFDGVVDNLTMERRFRHKQGHYVWTHATASRIRSPGDQPPSIVAVVQDITDRKLAEAALLEADRRKDEFLATLAHELRNPLAPICNSLHILRMAASDAGAQESLLEMMERQIKHLVRLVDDLLEISRITRGKIELRKEQIELAAVIRSAVEASRPLIESGQHRLAISLPAEPILLHADAVRLSQVFCNLLNNAAKHSKEGGQIWLTAHLRGRNVESGSEIEISVKDDGPGIPSDMLPKIFEMFTQISPSPQRGSGGLGIGLTLVRNLVELHGGTVVAHSDGPGMGSEFVVRLPAVAGQSVGIMPATSLERTAQSCSPLRILIVDDNRDAADTLGTLLAHLGWKTKVVYDGPAAIEAIAIYRPAVMLLDIGMPGMDGYEVVRQMRQRPEMSEIKVIALTGWGQEQDRRKTSESGFHYHLIKPVQLQELQSLLGSIVTDSMEKQSNFAL